MRRSDRYAEAFWWIVPIPAVVVAGAAVAALHPSMVGVVALGLLSVVGLSVEHEVWKTFRRRWAGDHEAHPTSEIPDRLRRPLGTAMAFGFLIAAIAWKAEGVGESWGVGVLIGVGYVAFVFAIGAVMKALGAPIEKNRDG